LRVKSPVAEFVTNCGLWLEGQRNFETDRTHAEAAFAGGRVPRREACPQNRRMLHMATNYLTLRTLVTSVIGLIALGILLFVPAGTLAYWQGWLFIVVFAVDHDPLLVSTELDRLETGDAAGYGPAIGPADGSGTGWLGYADSECDQADSRERGDAATSVQPRAGRQAPGARRGRSKVASQRRPQAGADQHRQQTEHTRHDKAKAERDDAVGRIEVDPIDCGAMDVRGQAANRKEQNGREWSKQHRPARAKRYAADEPDAQTEHHHDQRLPGGGGEAGHRKPYCRRHNCGDANRQADRGAGVSPEEVKDQASVRRLGLSRNCWRGRRRNGRPQV
jgi:hypothetical protein